MRLQTAKQKLTQILRSVLLCIFGSILSDKQWFQQMPSDGGIEVKKHWEGRVQNVDCVNTTGVRVRIDFIRRFELNIAPCASNISHILHEHHDIARIEASVGILRGGDLERAHGLTSDECQ